MFSEKAAFLTACPKKLLGTAAFPRCFSAAETGEHTSQPVRRAQSDCCVYETPFLFVKEMSLTHRLGYELCFVQATADLRLLTHRHCPELLLGGEICTREVSISAKRSCFFRGSGFL